ncbi:MAG: transcription antitermination factor NusB [Spirochaetota bacterium]
MASRNKSRTIALQGLYQIEIAGHTLEEVLNFHWYEKKIHQTEREYSEQLIKGVVKNWKLLDTLIKTYSENWEFNRISVINRCILRISIYSMINLRDTPPKVIMNEALELTRRFEGDSSVSFVNGILDSVYKDELLRQSGEM